MRQGCGCATDFPSCPVLERLWRPAIDTKTVRFCRVPALARQIWPGITANGLKVAVDANAEGAAEIGEIEKEKTGQSSPNRRRAEGAGTETAEERRNGIHLSRNRPEAPPLEVAAPKLSQRLSIKWVTKCYSTRRRITSSTTRSTFRLYSNTKRTGRFSVTWKVAALETPGKMSTGSPVT